MDLLVLVFTILTVLGLAILSLIFAFQVGWFDQFQTLQRLIHGINMTVNLIDNIAAVTKPTKTNNCSINNSNLSMSITYTRSGREKLFNIPYRSDLKEKMRMWRVHLVSANNKSKEITQEPGLPYICKPEQLGGKEILANNIETGQVIQFKSGTSPYYLGLDETVDSQLEIQSL
uniref:Uncharacterized protein n=1 Tax=Pithovirus LCPAC201 TaxID=2506591 RepID=A0A481Z4Z2_9VIRU|nr:MAG: uncharacterized protein LCPAC201_01580 [Pithovirus LCPAC201]